MFVSVAHAMGASGSQEAGGMMGFVPLLLMLAIFYFLLIRPQQKRAKEHRGLLSSLKKGDTIITNAGFIGRIVDIDGEVLTIDLGETKVKLGRPYVAGLSSTPMKSSDKPAKEDKAIKEDKTVVKDENGFVE